MPRNPGKRDRGDEDLDESGKTDDLIQTRSKVKASMVTVAKTNGLVKAKARPVKRVTSKMQKQFKQVVNNNAKPLDQMSDDDSEIIINWNKVKSNTQDKTSVVGDGVDVSINVQDEMEFGSDDEVEEMESDHTQPEQDARLILGQNENNPNQPAMIKAMLKELLNEELSEIKESL